jgi:hypothetical protein
VFAKTTRGIVIDSSGTPLAGKDHTDAAPGPGTIAITVADADLSNIKLVVKKQ